VEGTILRRIKGGVVVDLFGVDAFLPGSQIDLRQIPDMDSLIGKTYKFRVIKLNKARRNIVVSRRVILEEEPQPASGKNPCRTGQGTGARRHGQEHHGLRRLYRPWRVDGLLHITDMSWGRVNHPSEIVALGDKIQVKVLDFMKTRNGYPLGSSSFPNIRGRASKTNFPKDRGYAGKSCPSPITAPLWNWKKALKGLSIFRNVVDAAH